MAKSMKEHVKGLAEAMSDHHMACAKAHGNACDDNLSTREFEFHKTMVASHGTMAEKCKQLMEECSKADEAGDLEKITAVERALLATLAKTTIPDRVRATGTRANPAGPIGRQGDPPPQTQDAEIPQEFIDVFQL